MVYMFLVFKGFFPQECNFKVSIWNNISPEDITVNKWRSTNQGIVY